jgi:hypothetical protein
MKKRPFIVIAGVVIVALAAGVAYATIPDAQGVIHACYDKQSGQVRIVDTAPNTLPKGCGAKETAIGWNQTGPQGPAGPAGPQGPQGPQGAAGAPGPTPALFSTGVNSDVDGQLHVVASLQLPAADYVVTGSVTLQLQEDDGHASCVLRVNGITLDQQDFDFASDVEHDAATLMTDAQLAGGIPGTADVACSMTHDDPDAFIANGIKARLLAMHVNLQ